MTPENTFSGGKGDSIETAIVVHDDDSLAAMDRRLAADVAAVLVHHVSNRDRAAAVVAEIRTTGREAEAVGANLANQDGSADSLIQRN